MADIAATGKPSFYEPEIDNKMTREKNLAKPVDVIVIFNNGSYDTLKTKLKIDCNLNC